MCESSVIKAFAGSVVCTSGLSFAQDRLCMRGMNSNSATNGLSHLELSIHSLALIVGIEDRHQADSHPYYRQCWIHRHFCSSKHSHNIFHHL